MHTDSQDAELKAKKCSNARPNHPAVQLIQAIAEVFEQQRLKMSTTAHCAKTEFLVNIKLLCLFTFLGAVFCIFISAGWFGLLWLTGYALSLTALPAIVSYALPLTIHLLSCVYLWRHLKGTWRLFGMPKTFSIMNK